jgi:glycosyltransferase involved in cell wall biosynthesis
MKISIITINYNNSAGLQKTIESVLEQNYTDLEYIVIDGGSSDDSVDVIKKYECYISKWISEKDHGIYNALNKGIKIASGDYLLFLNSGDHFFSNNILKKNHHQLDGSAIVYFDIHVLGQGYNQINKHPDIIPFSYLFEDTFAHQSVFIKRNLFDVVGLYDESLKIVSDWKFFIRALAIYQCSYKCVHETLSVYYLDGISSSANGTFIRRSEREQVLKSEFSIFYDDYCIAKANKDILEMNRFQMLKQLEHTFWGRKVASIVLKSLTLFLGNEKTN